MGFLINSLFFLLPLIFFKNTSELFEFNKIIILYIFTILITASWIFKSINLKRFIFRRTILDIPLVAYLSVMLLSTLFSLDPRTSWLGYYSRFNGGLVSQICYALLYWAAVSNLKRKDLKKLVNFWVAGLLIASLLAILEHFGRGVTCGLMGLGWSVDCWVQDVQNRVFSTFGQPNWLAAALVATIPFTLNIIFDPNSKNSRKIIWSIWLFIFFGTLLFTKSRSGILAFGVELLIFAGFFFFYTQKKILKKSLSTVATLLVAFIFSILIFGTPWSKSILTKSQTKDLTVNKVQGPALESGGTDSGQIRKNVWLGAIEIWKHYPVFGTGLETYAFAFPMYKPVEHNLVSEWDFIYNKAHNEFLNYLATTGSLGFLAYLSLLGASVFAIIKSKNYHILAAYVGIMISNFFGFSVVFVSLLTFILPAMAIIYSKKLDSSEKNKSTDYAFWQWSGFIVASLTACFLMILTIRYWQADVYFNKGKLAHKSSDLVKAKDLLEKAIKFSSKEPIFWSEYSLNNSDIAIVLQQNNKSVDADLYAKEAISSSQNAIKLSPYNLNSKKIYVTVLSKLSQFDAKFLTEAARILEDSIKISPNDPKLYYQLGLMYLKNGKNDLGLKALEKAVELKPNYKEGRFALGLTYKDFEQFDKAKIQLNYILQKIDPNDELSKKYLDEMN